jgi:hypothetical protein
MDDIVDDEAGEEIGETEFAAWWARLPDVIKPTYPLDVPPDPMSFAQYQ